MVRASQRLSSTQETVAEIARSLGYDSASAFTKTFRRNTGQSPRNLHQATVPAIPAQYQATVNR
ncbi:MAG: helix-turn-helix domain-containing protein [Terracidiphilus sp.]